MMNIRYPVSFLFVLLLGLMPALTLAQGNRRALKEVPTLGEENAESRWAVVIGINNYARPKLNLRYAASDAQGFAESLVKNCGFSRNNIKLLLNEQATATHIRTALGTWLPRVAGRRDLVVIYFAGHGSPDLDKSVAEDGIRKYLVCHDADPKNLYATAVPMEELNSALLRLRSEKTVVLLDCCFSGAAPGASNAALPRTVFQAEVNGKTLKPGFLDTLAGSGAGRMVLTACAPNETSQEYADLQHGLFTYHLMQGLAGKATDKQGQVTILSLYDYVSDALANPGRNREPQKVIGSTSMAGRAIVLAGKGIRNTPVSGNGRLELLTSPLGADVIIDQRPPVKSPVRTELASGTHRVVILKRGYQPVETEITITPGNTNYQSFLLNSEKTTGTLLVEAAEGAAVTLDGKGRGAVPASGYLILDNLEAGPHTLKVEREGHQAFEKTTYVIAGAAAVAQADLPKELAGKRGPGAKDRIAGLERKGGGYVWEKDGAAMVFVSEGPFWMGSDGVEDARPRHEVTLPAFWIDRAEVTNSQFAAFVQAANYRVKGSWTPAEADREDFPATGVTLEDARAYAAWAGKILPTEAMWEKACRGTDDRLYPYGSAFNRLFQNVRASGYNRLLEVGTLSQGASPYGALDLLGNVAEWCDSRYEAYPGSPTASPNFTRGHYVVRGGSYLSSQEEASAIARSFLPPGLSQKDVGFRCAVLVP